MNKAKRRLQLSASIISVLALIAIIIIFFLQCNAQVIRIEEIYGNTGMPASFSFTQTIMISIMVLPGIIINLIMLKKPRETKTHKGLRITSCVLNPIYAIYFLTGSIASISSEIIESDILYGQIFLFPVILLFISLLLFIISFCVGNPKKRKLFVEDADLKIQTICRLQQMNLITKEEAKHFIFIQATK